MTRRRVTTSWSGRPLARKVTEVRVNVLTFPEPSSATYTAPFAESTPTASGRLRTGTDATTASVATEMTLTLFEPEFGT